MKALTPKQIADMMSDNINDNNGLTENLTFSESLVFNKKSEKDEQPSFYKIPEKYRSELSKKYYPNLHPQSNTQNVNPYIIQPVKGPLAKQPEKKSISEDKNLNFGETDRILEI